MASSPRVTVVGDSPEIRDMVGEVLTAWGFSITPLAGKDLPLETLAASDPDLIILEPAFPGDEGQELGWVDLRRLRSSTALAGVPVLLCTADSPALPDYLEAVAAYERAAVVAMPFTLPELEAAVRRLLPEAAPARR